MYNSGLLLNELNHYSVAIHPVNTELVEILFKKKNKVNEKRIKITKSSLSVIRTIFASAFNSFY